MMHVLLAALLGSSVGPAALDVRIASRAIAPGELAVVTITTPRDASGVRVNAFGRWTTAYAIAEDEAVARGEAAPRIVEGRWEALVGIDLEQPPGAYTLTIEARVGASEVTASRPLTVRPKRYPTRTLRVAPDFVNPPPAVEGRIVDEAKALRELYRQSTPERLWRARFVRPVPQTANSAFGTRSVFNGERRNPHAGTDFPSPAGTPVKAPNAGRIVLARDLYFTGNTVVIDHGLGVFSMLAHLSRVDVHEGDPIEAGQVVGLVGATGRVTGPHLHWALRVGDARVNPLSALALLGPPAAPRGVQ